MGEVGQGFIRVLSLKVEKSFTVEIKLGRYWQNSVQALLFVHTVTFKTIIMYPTEIKLTY